MNTILIFSCLLVIAGMIEVECLRIPRKISNLVIFVGCNLLNVHEGGCFGSILAAKATAEAPVFVGSYRDPLHPQWSRKISNSADSLIITGSDHKNGAGKWSIRARETSSGNLLVDFSNGILKEDWHSPAIDFPSSYIGSLDEGNFQNVNGKYDVEKNAIRWADGSVWFKTNVANDLIGGSGSGFSGKPSASF